MMNKTYKYIALAGCLLGCLAGSANAQSTDGAWAGWYVGGGVGALNLSFSEYETNSPDNPTDWNATYFYDGSNAVAVLYGGHMWQRENIVFGVEARAAFGGKAVNTAAEGSTVGGDYLIRHDNTFSLNGRVGYAVSDAVLLFVSGGVSVGQFTHDLTFRGVNEVKSRDFTGYNVGVGAEYKISDNGAIRFDVTYSDMAPSDSDAAVYDLFPGYDYTYDHESTLISVGYTHRF